MSSLVGFTAILGISADNLMPAIAAQRGVLAYFKWLKRLSIDIGKSKVELWGHEDVTECVHRTPDGALLALVGSPVGDVSWPAIEKQLSQITCPEDFELPWDGRVVLLKISADGRRWTMWNDWVGGIPVFHTQIGQGHIASTLEPVVVAAAGYTPNDFFLPGLVSLLVNGHYLGDWTLFKGMRVVPPDCVAEWDDQGFRWKQLRSSHRMNGGARVGMSLWKSHRNGGQHSMKGLSHDVA